MSDFKESFQYWVQAAGKWVDSEAGQLYLANTNQRPRPLLELRGAPQLLINTAASPLSSSPPPAVTSPQSAPVVTSRSTKAAHKSASMDAVPLSATPAELKESKDKRQQPSQQPSSNRHHHHHHHHHKQESFTLGHLPTDTAESPVNPLLMTPRATPNRPRSGARVLSAESKNLSAALSDAAAENVLVGKSSSKRSSASLLGTWRARLTVLFALLAAVASVVVHQRAIVPALAWLAKHGVDLSGLGVVLNFALLWLSAALLFSRARGERRLRSLEASVDKLTKQKIQSDAAMSQMIQEMEHLRKSTAANIIRVDENYQHFLRS